MKQMGGAVVRGGNAKFMVNKAAYCSVQDHIHTYVGFACQEQEQHHKSGV